MPPRDFDPEACRVIVDPEPLSGAWNMAIDEALLETAVAGGPATVRWYRWDRATLSLGYFQAVGAAWPVPERFARLPVVRRLTGGGAIIHDQELTYSCTLPAGHALAGDPRGLYTRVHERIFEVLADFGISARLRGNSAQERSGEFLCFGRGDDFDGVMAPSSPSKKGTVPLGNANLSRETPSSERDSPLFQQVANKVLGSAQRRRKGAVLQHGSLILFRSEWAPEFPGIFDCAGRTVPVGNLVERLADRVGALLGAPRAAAALSVAERERAASLAATGSIVEINK